MIKSQLPELLETTIQLVVKKENVKLMVELYKRVGTNTADIGGEQNRRTTKLNLRRLSTGMNSEAMKVAARASLAAASVAKRDGGQA